MKPGKKPFEFKVCPACGIEKPRSDYYKKCNTVSHKCKPCTNIDSKNRSYLYVGRYADYRKTWKREQTIKNSAYNQRRKELRAIRYQEIKDIINAARREEWAKNTTCSARKHSRHHHVKNNTPKWAELDKIAKFYACCPKGYHVDHIIPLKGKIDSRPVSGLHILLNLQYLTAEENRKKYCLITESYLASIEC